MQQDRRTEPPAQVRRDIDVVVVGVRAADCDDATPGHCGFDRGGVMRSIEDQHLLVIPEQPDVVVHVPAAAVEVEGPGGHELFDADGHVAAPEISTTERSTSPRCILAKASSTSSSEMISETKASRSNRPCR